MSEARIDVELVRRGLVRSRTAARTAIDEGRVRLDGRVVRKPAQPVDPAGQLFVVDETPYVARSAHKLIAALDSFQIDTRGLLALDVGASTGGFSQVLLERGARRVIALDVGHDQLVPELRHDRRVVVVEGENARELTPTRLAEISGSGERPELIVVDVSFIALGMVLPALVSVAASPALIVALIKPQFEVGRTAVRDGLVDDRLARHNAVRAVIATAQGLGLEAAGLIASPITGTAGNQEYLVVLRGDGGHPAEWEGALDALD